jgi:hypothetical protein
VRGRARRMGSRRPPIPLSGAWAGTGCLQCCRQLIVAPAVRSGCAAIIHPFSMNPLAPPGRLVPT